MDGKKFKIKHSDLKKALSFCVKAISSKPVTPAFKDFVFKIIGGNTLGVRSMNSEVGAYIRVPAESDEDFGFAVDATELFPLINSSRGEIEFTYSESEQRVLIKPQKGEYQLYAQTTIDHPTQDIGKEELIGTFDSMDFLHAISITKPIAQYDELQPWKGFVCLNTSGDMAEMVATDAWVLSLRENIKGTIEKKGEVLISPVAAELIKFMGSSKSISVSTTGKYTVYRGKSEIIVQLNTTAKYPNYKGLFPNSSNQVAIYREELIEDLTRISTVSGTEHHSVDVIFKANECIEFRASDRTFGKDGIEIVEIKPTFSGQLSVNSRLFLNLLKSRQSDELVIHFISHKTPLVIKGNDNISSLIMPIFYNQ